MQSNMGYEQARSLLLASVAPVETERVLLDGCAGRVLAQELVAARSVPPADSSAFDGYALRAADTANASAQRPVRLTPAGDGRIAPGTAMRISTGSALPPQADAVVKREDVTAADGGVLVHAPLESGRNVVPAGESVARGQRVAEAGTVIDAALLGMLAALGVARPLVYRRVRVGILSTGDEIVEADAPLSAGAVPNANRHALHGAVLAAGCEPVYLGLCRDSAEEIAARLREGMAACDAVLVTGGVSVGDTDMTAAAMELAGAALLLRNVRLKPGMACAYGRGDGALVCALSGNPASALTNYYAIVLPALKRLSGRRDVLPAPVRVALAEDFPKESPLPRLLRGRLCLSDGTARIRLLGDQGNAALYSAIGSDVFALVPAGSGRLAAGTVLEGFLL